MDEQLNDGMAEGLVQINVRGEALTAAFGAFVLSHPEMVVSYGKDGLAWLKKSIVGERPLMTAIDSVRRQGQARETQVALTLANLYPHALVVRGVSAAGFSCRLRPLPSEVTMSFGAGSQGGNWPVLVPPMGTERIVLDLNANNQNDDNLGRTVDLAFTYWLSDKGTNANLEHRQPVLLMA